MRRFLRRSSVEREPLALTMTGVRMGERVLQIGIGDTRLAAQIAARPGISGHAAIVVHAERDTDAARALIANAGVLADVHVAADRRLPLADDAFDVIVVHASSALITATDPLARTSGFEECRRVLRTGGRLIALEPGTPTGWSALLKRSAPTAPDTLERGTASALAAAGFKPVRFLADREGYRFFEALKT